VPCALRVAIGWLATSAYADRQMGEQRAESI